MINGAEIVPTCTNAMCSTPLYTGSCSKECLTRYKNETQKQVRVKLSHWINPTYKNDFIWVECSKCGFRIDMHVSEFYKFCPHCGKNMEVYR